MNRRIFLKGATALVGCMALPVPQPRLSQPDIAKQLAEAFYGDNGKPYRLGLQRFVIINEGGDASKRDFDMYTEREIIR